jgi:hypothetical protein
MTDDSPNLIYVTVYKGKPPRYRGMTQRKQQWRWKATSGDNHRVLASGEAYTNAADCLHAVSLLFGEHSNVYLRQNEVGNQVLRMAVPL